MIQPVKEKIILGIDPGTNIMGYGVLKVTGTRPQVMTLGVIDLRKCSDPYLKLKPRLTANATIYTLTKDNVLTVPNKALRFTPNKDIVGGRKINDCQSSHKVWTLDNNTFTAHPVKIGITDGSKTEIVSGITENTPVVTETVVKGAMPGMEEPSAGEGERSPFMPGPPGSNKKKNK